MVVTVIRAFVLLHGLLGIDASKFYRVETVGTYAVCVDTAPIVSQIGVLMESSITITQRNGNNEKSDEDFENNGKEFVVWKTLQNQAFIRLGNASMPRPPILDGNYQLEERTEYLSNFMGIDDIIRSEKKLSVTIKGKLYKIGKKQDKDEEVAKYSLVFFVDSLVAPRLRFTIDIVPNAKILQHVPSSVSSSIHEAGVTNQQIGSLQPRTFLTYWCEKDEGFYGFGESFTFFNLRGRRVPILVSEQGVGRGEQPITDYLNTAVAEGVGGHWYTTYAPKPLYTTNHNRTFLLDNSHVSFFDLRGGGATAAVGHENDEDGSDENVVVVEVWSWEVSGSVWHSASLLAAVETLTAEVTGRQGVLPEWSQRGAVVGLEGGTHNVTRIVAQLDAAGVPLAGVWLQDWVGLQHSWDGDRLIWNWELNKDWYPNWNKMVNDWREKGIRVLTYMSPFFADPSAYSDSTTAFRHNYFQEGVEQGYFVHRADGSTYLMYSLSIEFAMLDLTNPAAVKWMQNIIIDASITEAGSSGWMCDFGEYLPFDAVLHSGESAASFHNRYPQEWGALTKAAIDRATAQSSSSTASTASTLSLSSTSAEDIVYFMRSAWMQSPSYTPLFWLGDQLVSWDKNDGIKSAVTGALSSSLSGHSITHSDIGGYTVEVGAGVEGGPLYYVRTPELLKRWSELSAFGFGLYRTHIGSSTTPLDAQIYDDAASMAHFARFAHIYAHLAPLRMALMQESKEHGHPLIRPLCMHYGYDEVTWTILEQYLVGESDLLVAPVLYEGNLSVSVYFPQHSGPWVHVWSGKVIETPEADKGRTVEVPAPIGFPPVFYRQNNAVTSSSSSSSAAAATHRVNYGEQLRSFIISRGYDRNFAWDASAAAATNGINDVADTATTSTSSSSSSSEEEIGLGVATDSGPTPSSSSSSSATSSSSSSSSSSTPPALTESLVDGSVQRESATMMLVVTCILLVSLAFGLGVWCYNYHQYRKYRLLQMQQQTGSFDEQRVSFRKYKFASHSSTGSSVDHGNTAAVQVAGVEDSSSGGNRASSTSSTSSTSSSEPSPHTRLLDDHA